MNHEGEQEVFGDGVIGKDYDRLASQLTPSRPYVQRKLNANVHVTGFSNT
jgi:hypothetical protein